MPQNSIDYFKRLYDYENPITPDDYWFESSVREYLTPQYKDTLDKTKAGNVATPKDKYNYMGFNTRDTKYSELPDRYKSEKTQGLKSLMEQGKNVFGVGAGASPSTFAHEFRHNKIQDETNNRVADLLASPSYADYVRNLANLYAEAGANKDLRARAERATAFKSGKPFELPLKKMENELEAYIGTFLMQTDTKHNSDNNYAYWVLTLEDQKAINQGKYTPDPDKYKYIDNPDQIINFNDVVDWTHGKSELNQKVPKTLIMDRNDFPGLHFIGKAEDPETKAAGGPVELLNNYRAGGRTRMI